MAGKWKKSKQGLTNPVDNESEKPKELIKSSLSDNIIIIREQFGESFDLIIRQTEVNSVKVAFVVLDGMYDNVLVAEAVVEPVMKARFIGETPEDVFFHLTDFVASECDMKEELVFDKAVQLLLAGNLLLFVDGVAKCRSFSVQGYVKKSVDEPQSEVQENGSHEGFADMYKDNVTLVRRRIKSPYVRFETMTAGATSNTMLCICYHAKRADPVIVNDVKSRLQNMELDIVPGAGSIKPFLETNRLSLFSSVGITERPDVFAAKISEGRVGIIVDGTPYALVVPHLFIENFHSLDDYLSRPYYAAMIRVIKLFCFFAAIFLPGAYVAVGTFHQEIFPADILYEIAAATSKTPFPLFVEALVIHFIYEIVREAGLRMPKSVGHTVSIVGALVIGDAAVSAGLISAPMLIVVAVTAICSAVMPSFHQPSAVLRFVFIIVGGVLGLYGIILGFGMIIGDICSINSYGVPFTSPISPFDRYGNRDAVIFAGWKKTGKRHMQIQNLRGSERDAGISQ